MVVTKPINMAPLRLQRMMIRLQSYDVHITYCKVKEKNIADTLSRATVNPPEKQMDADVLVYSMKEVTSELMDKVELIRSKLGKDPELSVQAVIMAHINQECPIGLAPKLVGSGPPHLSRWNPVYGIAFHCAIFREKPYATDFAQVSLPNEQVHGACQDVSLLAIDNERY